MHLRWIYLFMNCLLFRRKRTKTQRKTKWRLTRNIKSVLRLFTHDCFESQSGCAKNWKFHVSLSFLLPGHNWKYPRDIDIALHGLPSCIQIWQLLSSWAVKRPNCTFLDSLYTSCIPDRSEFCLWTRLRSGSMSLPERVCMGPPKPVIVFVKRQA